MRDHYRLGRRDGIIIGWGGGVMRDHYRLGRRDGIIIGWEGGVGSL